MVWTSAPTLLADDHHLCLYYLSNTYSFTEIDMAEGEEEEVREHEKEEEGKALAQSERKKTKVIDPVFAD